MRRAEIQLSQIPTVGAGWRQGRPVEDPEKTKRWGFVTAKPSEYLVHVRRGEVRRASSGQGATCFKWPWDAVAVVPTSFQRLMFRADPVSYTHLRAHETVLDLVCRLLLEKKKTKPL